jgi:hypothetical protein
VVEGGEEGEVAADDPVVTAMRHRARRGRASRSGGRCAVERAEPLPGIGEAAGRGRPRRLILAGAGAPGWPTSMCTTRSLRVALDRRAHHLHHEERLDGARRDGVMARRRRVGRRVLSCPIAPACLLLLHRTHCFAGCVDR